MVEFSSSIPEIASMARGRFICCQPLDLGHAGVGRHLRFGVPVDDDTSHCRSEGSAARYLLG